MHDQPATVTPASLHCRDLFEIYDFTSVLVRLQDSSSPVFHLDYSLIWIQQGEGELFIDSQEFSIGNNVLYCLRPGQQLRFQPAVWGIGFVVCFSEEFLDLHETKTTGLVQESLFNQFLLTPVVNLKHDATTYMHLVATKMLAEFSSDSAYKKEILKGFLKIFIIYASRAAYNIGQPAISKKIAMVQQFYLLLEKYFVSKKLVKDYAEMLQVSAGHLNDAVRELSGATASHYIQQRVLREAKRRICPNGSSMKEIAYSLGFSDQAHFSKYFKNISGKNFTDFKKEITS